MPFKNGEDCDETNKLLKDIKTISKALSLDKISSRNSTTPTKKSRPKSAKKANLPDPKSKPKDDNAAKEKKSIWNWKPLKALSLSRNRRFGCCFSLQVHSIEGLPSSFDGASFCVYWRRKDDLMVTPPAKVVLGAAVFEELLTYTCTIHGRGSGPQNSAKYEAKHSLLYASMVGAAELDFGKHRVDLTRFLPLTLEELLEEKSSGKWTTSFRLSGTAKDAMMNVSFGYVVARDKASATGDNPSALSAFNLRQSSLSLMKTSQSDSNLMRTGSLPCSLSCNSEYSSRSVDEVKDLHEVLPLSKSASLGDILFKEFDEEKTCCPLHNKLELDVFIEYVEPKKPDVYSSSDIGKDKPEENPDNEGKTFSPVHGKSEFDVPQETLETVKSDGCSLPDSGKEKPGECEGNVYSFVDKGVEFSSHEHVELEECTVKALVDDHTFDSARTSSDIGNDKPKDHPGNEGKAVTQVPPQPEFDVHQENLETVKPDGYPIPDCGKENLVECEVNGFSFVDKGFEFSSHEHVELEECTVKALVNDHTFDSACTSSDIGNDKPKDHPGNKGKAITEVPPQPEYDMHQENLETVKPDGYPIPDCGKENPEECEGNGFSFVCKGVEFSSHEHVELEECTVKALADDHTFDNTCTLDTAGIQISFEDNVKHDTQDEVDDSPKEKAVIHEFSYKEDKTKELLLQEIDTALNSVSDLEAVALESPNIMEGKSECKMSESHSLDDLTDSVASEFLSMLGIDHSPIGLSPESDPESPRERLLRQFELETLSEGFSLFDFDMGNDNEGDGGYKASFGYEPSNFSNGIKSSSFLEDMHEGHLMMSIKQKAQMLEDLETEALMHEWGLNEKAFQNSPPKDSAGLESPISLLHEEPLILPPLADGLGPFLRTKDGGFLRSMNPLLFRNTKSGGNLIMQISNPVVVPAEMGSGIMEILQCLASMGIEKLSMQANKLMPLEDITGKTMQQIAWEAMSVQGKERQCHLQHNLVTWQDTACVLRGSKGTSSGLKACKLRSGSVGNKTGSELVSLEALAPLATYKIEALSMEGLRIQSGMSDEDAPSNIEAQSFGDISALHGKGINISGSLGLDGAAALQLLDTKDSSDSVDEIMGLSLTLDEWMRLDSGEIDDIDNISEHTSKLLAAHHANTFDLIRGSSKGERTRGKDPRRKRGLLGNNFTVALMVQLRDPLRNYEPVGIPMLGLIQVERVFVPPKQNIKSVSELVNINDEDDDDDEDECEIVAKVEEMKEKKKEEQSSEEVGIPQFRITEVHVAGSKTEPHKKKLWGTSRHQQSGSRWLLAHGMGKSKKDPLMKSMNASKSSAPVTTKVQPGDTLWSISSRIYGTGAKWMELVSLNSHIRNPDIIIPNETKRIR